jgi:hypothetical protein
MLENPDNIDPTAPTLPSPPPDEAIEEERNIEEALEEIRRVVKTGRNCLFKDL